MRVIAYTDASHCGVNKVSACGFIVLFNGKMIKHEITFLGDINSTQYAETFAIVNALQYCFLLDGVSEIKICTDCLAAVHCFNTMRRSLRKRRIVFNEMIDTLEEIMNFGIFVEMEKIKSHSGNKFNDFIDQSSRHQLKKYLKTQNEKSFTGIVNRNGSVRLQ